MAKVRVKVPLTEISDADVTWVSMVRKPANRIPFRVTKDEDGDAGSVDDDGGNAGEASTPDRKSGDKTMKNILAALVGSRKSDGDDSTGTLAAVVIRKDDAETMLPKLEAAGLQINDTEEANEYLVVKQADYDAEDETAVAFRVNDDVAVVYTGVRKQFSPFLDSLSFAETMAAGGFLPQLNLAGEALQDTVRTVLRSSESKQDAKDRMQTVLDDYASFVGTMVDNLPEVAFKLDSADLSPDIAPSDGDEGAQDDEKAEEKDKQKAKDKDGKEKQNCPPGTRWDPATGTCKAVEEKDKDAKDKAKNADKSKGKKDDADDDCADCDKTDKKDEKDGDEEDLPLAAADQKSDADDDKGEDGEWYDDVEDPTYKAALEEAELIRKTSGDSNLIHADILNPRPPRKRKVAQEEADGETGATDEDGTSQKAEADDQTDGETGDDAGDTAKKADGEDAPTKEILDQLGKVLEVATALKEDQSALRQDVEALGERVQSVETKAESTRKRQDGLILTGGDELPNEGLGNLSRSGRETQRKGDDLWAGTALDKFAPGS